MEYVNLIKNTLIIITPFLIIGGLISYYKNNLWPHIEYKLVKTIEKITKRKSKEELAIDKKVISMIEYNEYQRELILDIKGKREVLLTPQYDSEPEKLIKYLVKFNNSNRNVSRKELLENAGISSKSYLPKLVSDLKFTGKRRQLHFKVSKTSVYLTNQVINKHLRESNISLDEILD